MAQHFKYNNHGFVQFPCVLVAIAALLLACEPENNAGLSNGKQEDEFSVLEWAVDLGIVMTRENGSTYKLYWAKSNLCESGLCANPEDYGDYYAWGETEPKSDYSWSTYKWCNGNYNSLTKYNTSSDYGTVDNKTVLDSEDDVAHVKLGGKWRMPTDAEWTKLITECIWEWTSNYNGTGKAGRIVTATNGNSIFLPAAGGRGVADLDYADSRGYYWSSSLDTYPVCAWFVYFHSSYRGWNSRSHCYGFSVRPVSE